MILATRSCAALAALALLWPALPASAEDMVVVAARGIGLHPGERVDSAKPLVLGEGQHVTLIAVNGVTLKLDGPYDKPPAAAGGGSDLTTALNALATQQEARTTEVGATRAGGEVATLPEPWVLDVSRTGNVCLLDKQQPVSCRPTAAAAATMVVMSADRSWKAQAVWPKGSNRLIVSDTWAVHGDAIYFVSFDHGEEAAVTINRVPSDLPGTPMRAAWLANRGCEAQAEALLRPRP